MRVPGGQRVTLRSLESLEHIQQRKVISIFQIVDSLNSMFSSKPAVCSSRLYQCEPAWWLPTCYSGDFRRDILQPGIQIDFSFFLQFQKAQRDKRLLIEATRKFRVAVIRRPVAISALPDSSAPEKLTFATSATPAPGYVLLVEDVPSLPFCNPHRSSDAEDLLSFVAPAPGGRQAQRGSEK